MVKCAEGSFVLPARPPLAIGLLQEAKHAVMRAGKGGGVKRAAVDLFKAWPGELQSCPAFPSSVGHVSWVLPSFNACAGRQARQCQLFDKRSYDIIFCSRILVIAARFRLIPTHVHTAFETCTQPCGVRLKVNQRLY